MRVLRCLGLTTVGLLLLVPLGCEDETSPDEDTSDEGLLSDDEIDMELLEECQSYCRRLGVCWDDPPISKDEVVQCVDNCEYLLRTAHGRSIDKDLLGCNAKLTCETFNVCIKAVSTREQADSDTNEDAEEELEGEAEE